MNLRMLSYMARPCSIALTIVAKLSSSNTMSATSRATSVPPRPMAIPISAAFKAGASFTPSPVTATIWPLALYASTIFNLCAGVARAKIIGCSCSNTFCSVSASIFSTSTPLITVAWSFTSPICLPTASPVKP